ncbi:SDR family oxidoreductase [Buchnera aphidicola (Hormaphis cornu)]|nr:SDR family oxidoreductase [Buchnera aphidicola (Hormaphis cornu)]
MGFLQGKRILITGLLNRSSIAFGIAQSMYEQQAELAFTYKSNHLKKKVTKYAQSFNSKIVIACNMAIDNSIIQLFRELSIYWKNFDGFIHSIAFAPTNQFSSNYLNFIDRKSFRITHEITSYSFIAMVKACKNMLNANSALLTITYLGANFVVPNYNVMGSAKASLEANTRYLAYYLGDSKIRVNAISIGPIKTSSTAVFNNFKKILHCSKMKSPLKRNVSIYEVGHVASFLCSNLSSGISGQVIYVDGGSGIVYS